MPLVDGALLKGPDERIYLFTGGERRWVQSADGSLVRIALPPLEEQTLVKGTGDELFLMDGGQLRWVPSLSLLEVRRIPWR